MLILRVEAEMVRIGGGGAWEGPVFLGLDHGDTEVSGPLVTHGWDRETEGTRELVPSPCTAGEGMG